MDSSSSSYTMQQNQPLLHCGPTTTAAAASSAVALTSEGRSFSNYNSSGLYNCQSSINRRDSSSSYARVDITVAGVDQRRWAEIIFPLDFSVEDVKEKVFRHTGIPSSDRMHLFLQFPNSAASIPFSQPQLTLRDLGCLDGCTLHVKYEPAAGEEFLFAGLLAKTAGAAETSIHSSPSGLCSLEGKYVMSEELYEQRKGTMRKFLQQLQQQRPQLFQTVSSAASTTKPSEYQTSEEAAAFNSAHEENAKNEVTEEELARFRQAFPLGSRCRLSGDRRGVIAFVGVRPSTGRQEVWIGVALDEPLGTTDGHDISGPLTTQQQHQSQQHKHKHTQQRKRGEKLFSCTGEKYGEFALPKDVEIGEFPPLDPFDLIDEI